MENITARFGRATAFYFMILRKISLSHWRAHRELELVFGDGLCVVQGRNEAGKSSLVEALDWILSRDIVGAGARIKGEEIRAVVPASEPTARPRAGIAVEFGDCRVVVSKTVADDSGKRECTLVLRREGAADEHFERTEAQARWKQIVAADGLGTERGAVAEGGLMIAHQGESADFLTDGSATMRATIGIGNDGEIALTRRLESVRAEAEKARKRELLLEFSPLAIGAARAGTEAATARDTLQQLREEQRKYEAYEREIEELRDQIEALDARWREFEPAFARAKAKIQELGELLNAQTLADNALKDLKIALENARRLHEETQNRARTVEKLREQQSRAAAELESFSADLEAGRERLQALKTACEEGEAALGELGAAWNHEREIVAAWRAVFDVFEARTRYDEQKSALESLQNLGAALQDAENILKNAPKAPSYDEIRGWRALFSRYEELQKEANLSLQLEIQARGAAPIQGRFKADSGAIEALEIAPKTTQNFAASAQGILEIAGVGVVKIKTGARGALELKEETEAARTRLETALRDWKIEFSACPEAFDIWENRRAQYEEILAARDGAAADLKREEARVGALYQAQTRVEEAKSEWNEAKNRARDAEKLIEFRVSERVELGDLRRPQVRLELQHAIECESDLQSRVNRAKNEANTALQRVREAEIALGKIENRPAQLRAAMEQRELEIGRLCDDGLDDNSRASLVAQRGHAAIRAQIAFDEAQNARRELGDGVNPFKVEEARRAEVQLAEERAEVEKELVRLRTSLGFACDQDPATKLQELEAKISVLEPETARHETRLRGLALLDAAIQAERLKLSRDLAGPINEKLGPFLTQLRGKETALEFDGAGTKIERVRTKEGESTISLPFSEHSEGMKEQVAFALRLILAQKVAKNLPSQKLPVVLDDPFTQSDSARRKGLAAVLREVLPHLQILFVTCHDAPEIEATRLTLGDWFEEEPAVPSAPKSRRKIEKIAPREEALALF